MCVLNIHGKLQSHIVWFVPVRAIITSDYTQVLLHRHYLWNQKYHKDKSMVFLLRINDLPGCVWLVNIIKTSWSLWGCLKRILQVLFPFRLFWISIQMFWNPHSTHFAFASRIERNKTGKRIVVYISWCRSKRITTIFVNAQIQLYNLSLITKPDRPRIHQKLH